MWPCWLGACAVHDMCFLQKLNRNLNIDPSPTAHRRFLWILKRAPSLLDKRCTISLISVWFTLLPHALGCSLILVCLRFSLETLYDADGLLSLARRIDEHEVFNVCSCRWLILDSASFIGLCPYSIFLMTGKHCGSLAYTEVSLLTPTMN